MTIPTALSARNVIPIRAVARSAVGPVEAAAPNREQDQVVSLNDTQRCVYDALNSLGWNQLVRTGHLADLTGLRPPAVSKALAVLADRGLAVRLAHGEWQSTAVASARDSATSTDATEEALG